MGSTYTPENMVLSSVVGPTLTKYSLSLIEISFVLFISFPQPLIVRFITVPNF